VKTSEALAESDVSVKRRHSEGANATEESPAFWAGKKPNSRKSEFITKFRFLFSAFRFPLPPSFWGSERDRRIPRLLSE